jgi:hypothetical protein
MKSVEVVKLVSGNEVPSLEDLSVMMDKLQANAIDVLNWEKYSYKPSVAFSIASSDKELFLKYYVAEKCFKADHTKSNQEVYEDSCVEFFVSPGGDNGYYNFEFNGIGTCLMGRGTGRNDRVRLDSEIISRIRRMSTMGNKPVGEIHGDITWSITIAIPFGVFTNHEENIFAGKEIRANFYKCGDKLTVPHYVTWNPVGTEKPDFHRPEFFGFIKFV